MGHPCAFGGCPSQGARIIRVTAGEAATWALVPSLLDQVDRVVERDGGHSTFGLFMCEGHAEGVAPRAPRVYHERPLRERMVLAYLADRGPVGGATVDDIALHFGWYAKLAQATVAKLTADGSVERSGRMGATRRGKRAAMFKIKAQEPPAVQPAMGDPTAVNRWWMEEESR